MLEDPEGQWEMVGGRGREKPGMTQEHNSAAWWLGLTLQGRLDARRNQVRVNMAQVLSVLGGVVVVVRAV